MAQKTAKADRTRNSGTAKARVASGMDARQKKMLIVLGAILTATAVSLYWQYRPASYDAEAVVIPSASADEASQDTGAPAAPNRRFVESGSWDNPTDVSANPAPLDAQTADSPAAQPVAPVATEPQRKEAEPKLIPGVAG